MSEVLKNVELTKIVRELQADVEDLKNHVDKIEKSRAKKPTE